MAMGCPAKGYKLTPSRIDVLRALAIHGPFVDDKGRAVSLLLPFTAQRRPQSLSCALEGLEAVGLVRRETHSQRTYRIEVVLDRLTPADLVILDLPEPSPVVPAAEKTTGLYLTRPRVEVFRALLADGPIDDPAGHATRILMGRLGRSDFGGTHALVTGMARVGLIRRTVRQGRVVGLAAAIDHLPDNERHRIWSTVEFPVDAVSPVEEHPSSCTDDDMETLRAELEAARTQIEAQQAELEAEKVENARLRIQYEMFRAWAKRMPAIDSLAPVARTPAGDDAIDPVPILVERDEVANLADEDEAQADEQACQYVYSAHDPDRHGQACGRPPWEGSTDWCWAHDPTPVIRRKAFPVRQVATTSSLQRL